MGRNVDPAIALGAERLQALHEVDLYLGFVTTGAHVYDADQGSWHYQAANAAPNEYAAMEGLSERLVPRRDILAYRYDDPVGKHRLQRLALTINHLVRDEPTLSPDERQALTDQYDRLPKPNSIRGERLASTWRRLTNDHIIDPIDTATGLAAMEA